MKELTIQHNDAGQRLDRFLAKAVPLLPASLAQKYIRIKRIKLNGARAERDTRLKEGDVLQLYINDEFFDKPREDNAYLTVASPKLNIVYEDDQILLVDKRPGLAVHPHDGAEYGRTLIDHIQAYLYQKHEWSPRSENSLVECKLITGRTHQIRAQFAHAGHPLLGDGKYGKLDKRFDRNYQALYSYRLRFDFTTDAGSLGYLNGKSFQVEQVDFVAEYFPGYRL